MKPFILCAVALAMVVTSGYCEATSIYSFKGEVSNLFYDGAGIIATEGFEIGDRVHAKFNVDFERDGYFILNNGETVIPESPPLTNSPFWYFYASLISGTLLPEINGGFNNRPEHIKEYNIGYYNSGPAGNRGALKGGTGDSNFIILKESYLDAGVENWVIGEDLKGIIVGWSDKNWSIMWADMTLVGIQSDSVPEPSTLLLLGSGLIGLAGIRRKFKN